MSDPPSHWAETIFALTQELQAMQARYARQAAEDLHFLINFAALAPFAQRPRLPLPVNNRTRQTARPPRPVPQGSLVLHPPIERFRKTHD